MNTRCLVVPVGILALAGAARAAEEAPARSFVIFAGLDVFVEDRGTRRAVVGGSETEVLVWDERRGEAVAVRDVALSAAVEPRLTGASVAVDGLRGYPVYSPANDPATKSHAQQVFLHNLEGARLEESEMKMRTAQAVADLANARVTPGNAQQAEQAAQARVAAEEAVAESSAEMGTTVYRESRIGSAGGEGDFDGFAVAFEVSTPQALDDAYGVLRLRYRESTQPGATLLHAMKLFRLRKLDAKPRKVVVRQFGLRPGFSVESFQVHLYAEGRELATNLSPNRVAVTEDEAHQFLILRHVHRHAAASLPVQIAPELLRPAPPALADGGVAALLVNVEVDVDGRVTAVVSGAVGAELLDELRRVRFLPALLNGRPVVGRGAFAVGELFLGGTERRPEWSP